MGDVLRTIGEGFEQSFLKAYQVWWRWCSLRDLRVVQAWVPRERIEATLAAAARSRSPGDALGAASRPALRGDLDRQVAAAEGASATTALAFQFASTNLVWELGLCCGC